jgi:hypothetical protein
MKQTWRKLGLLYRPVTDPTSENHHTKLISHAANPLAVFMDGDIYRIFFSGRDADNRSSVGGVDVDILTRKIVKEYSNPFFSYGQTESFYADGVSIGNCYEVDGVLYMLFMGWQNPTGSHWRGDIGRLIVNPDLSLTLDSEAPFLGISTIDPISLSYPWVVKDEVEGYKMWYGSTMTWDAGNSEMLHVINFASSSDGHDWYRQGLAIPYEIGIAQAFSRPSVIGNSKEGYQMWFSYRSGTGEKYRIGYAFSEDGSSWKLDLDSAGIEVSDQGWDSEMIEYPFVFSHKGEHYMLYNGNGYGKTGFGLAILEEEKT